MLPLPMNEYLQQNLKECNFDISFEVVDWGTMLVAMHNPPIGPQSRGVDAVNISLAHGTEFSRFPAFSCPAPSRPTASTGLTGSNPEFDALVDKIEKSSDPEEIAADIRRAHEVIVDDAAWLFIVHDLNPRAMTKHVKGFVSAQSWFQDFTRVYME
jgi:peptide/nickel transport system substrate-binding protein